MKKQEEKLQEQIMHKPLLLRRGGGIRVGDQRVVVEGLKVGHKVGKSLGNAFIVAKRVTLRRVSLSHEVSILASEEEACLRIADYQVEWVVDTMTSYHATPCKEMFTTYKVGDFGTIKMDNTSHSKIVRTGDVCIQTEVGCIMTLKDV